MYETTLNCNCNYKTVTILQSCRTCAPKSPETEQENRFPHVCRGSDVTDFVPTFLRFVLWWPKMRHKSVKEPKRRKLINEKQK